MNLLWRTQNLKNDDGILVGADITQEWLLPWWWKRYAKHNNYPVAFIDFGMSFEKKDWCSERGELIPLRILDDFVAEKKEMDPQVVAHLEDEFGQAFWSCRSVWFRKPLGFLQTPFKRTIWIDLDCEIRGSLSSLFSYAEPLGMIVDPCDTLAEYSYPIYNSGVVPFQRNLDWIVEWARICIKKNGEFRGDQEAFSHFAAENQLPIKALPLKYNWSRTLKENAEAQIVHWHGIYGKYVIRNQINVEELSF